MIKIAPKILPKIISVFHLVLLFLLSITYSIVVAFGNVAFPCFGIHKMVMRAQFYSARFCFEKPKTLVGSFGKKIISNRGHVCGHGYPLRLVAVHIQLIEFACTVFSFAEQTNNKKIFIKRNAPTGNIPPTHKPYPKIFRPLHLSSKSSARPFRPGVRRIGKM